MQISAKQAAIIKLLREREAITFAEIRAEVDDYYHNGAKHTSEVISRMVKQGYIIRVRRGVYALNTQNPKLRPLYQQDNQNQMTLF